MFFSLHWWSRSTVLLADIRFSYIVWFLTLLSTLSLPSWVLVGFLVCSVAASLSAAASAGRRRCWRSRDSSSTLPLHKIDDVLKILKFFSKIWHIQVRLKQIAARVNDIYKCGYIVAFVFLDLQVRVDQMRL